MTPLDRESYSPTACSWYMDHLRKADEFRRREGFFALLTKIPLYLYKNGLRPRLPRKNKFVKFNGVDLQPYRIGDSIIPINPPMNQGGHPNPEEYEYELVKQIKKRVQPTDTAVIIGGGLGVSTVVAAQKATNGQIICFEGAKGLADLLPTTVEQNGVFNRVDVHHAVVAEAVMLEGMSRGAEIVEPNNLPECDVLIMDCEGAEEEILKHLEIQPRELIVETHGNVELISDLVEGLGYNIESKGVAERPPLENKLRGKGIFVFGARMQNI